MLRVLIVEDEALVAMEIESMLILAGHDTIGLADDMATAMAAVDIELPDLALVDMQLAHGCSGLDVAAALVQRGVPVMFATGNCPCERGQLLALGCLHKPFNDQTMAAAIGAAEIMLGGRFVPALPPSLHLYAGNAH